MKAKNKEQDVLKMKTVATFLSIHMFSKAS